jgi:hypothetical protein
MFHLSEFFVTDRDLRSVTLAPGILRPLWLKPDAGGPEHLDPICRVSSSSFIGRFEGADTSFHSGAA